MKTKSQFIICTLLFIVMHQFLFAQTSWELTGNSGTNSSTNFVGTTDNKPLIFRTKNIARMRITSGGYVGIGLASPLQKLHVNGNINADSSYGYYINNVRVMHISGNTTSAPDQTNFFAGQYAGNSITTGFWNAACGYNALRSNTEGGGNTATGYNALYSNTTAGNNTATGVDAMHYTTTGGFNGAFGSLALFYNTTGSSNTAIGYAALENNIDGSHNTAVGSDALETNTTGNHNTALGYNSDVNSGNLQNTTAIGYNALNTASNQVRIGNSSVSSIGGYVNWSNISDGRYKKNIKEDVPGLAFIKALKPVTYNLDITGVENFLHKHIDKINKQDIEAKEKIRFSGFVAQDVEKTAKQLGYDFSGVDAPKNDKDIYGLRYADFVVPLVKAVQELSAENQELKSRLEKIEQSIAANNSNKEDAVAIKLTGSYLEQNAPNPFKENTRISYSLPLQRSPYGQNFANAFLNITNMDGKAIKQLKLNSVKGVITVDASMLSVGTYNYTLIVDGKNLETKRMIIAK